VSDTDDLVDNAPVTLMTVHSAKGLEFPLVFVVGLEEGLFPHVRVMDDSEELEEERRLFYVAITRAKQQLYLTQAQRRRVYGEERLTDPSQFLEEIPEDTVQLLAPSGSATAEPSSTKKLPRNQIVSDQFRLGDRVEHATYGTGQVVRVADGKLDIAFPGKGIKRFVAAAAPLTKLPRK
jgi:DNA helicase-2/ATP-dependent DNA helicase PcrA